LAHKGNNNHTNFPKRNFQTKGVRSKPLWFEKLRLAVALEIGMVIVAFPPDRTMIVPL
jgi:hypothetical protein